MIALGWTSTSTAVPAPLSLVNAGTLRVIVAPQRYFEDPHARLTLLQACFETGVDFVPLSAARILTVDQAQQIAATCADDLRAQLTRISGAGQLYVSVTSVETPPSALLRTDGRAWLQAKRDHLRQTERSTLEVRALLDALTIPLPYQCSDTVATSLSCARALLVRRGDAAQARAKLHALGANMQSDPALRVDVTGLWPAFGFVTTPLADIAEYV